MSQVNSQLATKACTYDFNVEGDCLVGKYLGLTFNPGETILDLKVKILSPFAGATDATNFYLQWQSPIIGSGVPVFQKQKINTGLNPINNGLGIFEDSPEVGCKFNGTNPLHVPFPIGYLGDLNIYFASTNSITAGSLLAVFTYVKHNI